MKSKTIKKNKVNIITLGCSKNLVDSEQLGKQLDANNIKVVHENKRLNHNIVIVNTCGFIDKAKEESVNTILEQIELKKQQKIDKLFVTGCLSERYKSELAKELKEVDAFFGTMEMPQLLKQLNADYKHELIGERLLSTPKHYAYLKISEGCNRTCSFCAIPLMRGSHVSKKIEDIVNEAKYLVKTGVKEIMLIAQELTYYGLDIYKKRALPELLRQLSDIEGLHWIRLHYAYPAKFPLEILDVMNERSNICKYIDLPLQHISDNILTAMNRQITKQEIFELIREIKSRVPDICIRSSFIVGFPGEEGFEFDELKQFVMDAQLDRVGIFTYSQEQNTSAYSLGDILPAQFKESRAEQIMEVLNEISYLQNQQKIGKTFKVIIDKKEAGKYIGRTEYDSVEVDNEVIIKSKVPLPIGEFVNVKITNAYDYDLEGVVVS